MNPKSTVCTYSICKLNLMWNRYYIQPLIAVSYDREFKHIEENLKHYEKDSCQFFPIARFHIQHFSVHFSVSKRRFSNRCFKY